LKELWSKFPVWIRALVIAALLFFPVISINQLLLFQNLFGYTSVAWSLPVIIFILWLYWRFTIGANKPFKPSDVRRDLSMTSKRKGGSLAGAFISIMGLMLFTYSAVAIGYAFLDEGTDQLEMIKLFTAPRIAIAIPLILGLALTAGIVEEIVFRGYLQTMLERGYGVVISFGVTAIIFALLHFLPQILLVPYMLVSLAFSYVAYRSRTIVPGIIAHAGFDFVAIVLIYFNPEMAEKTYFEESLVVSVILLIISVAMIWYSQDRLVKRDTSGL